MTLVVVDDGATLVVARVLLLDAVEEGTSVVVCLRISGFEVAEAWVGVSRVSVVDLGALCVFR